MANVKTKKKGKGCLVAIGVVVALSITVGHHHIGFENTDQSGIAATPNVSPDYVGGRRDLLALLSHENGQDGLRIRAVRPRRLDVSYMKEVLETIAPDQTS